MCSRIPYPPNDGAKLRMFFTARELAKEYDVELLVIGQEPVSQSAIQSLEERFEEVHVFSYPKHDFYLNTISGLVSRNPLQTHYYEFDSVKAWIDEQHKRFDLLYCNHVRTAEYARKYDIPSVVDLVDAISRTYREAIRDVGCFWQLIYRIEWRRLQRYERTIVKQFDHSFIVTETDRQFVLDGEPNQSLSVLPNGVKPSVLEQGCTGYRESPSAPRIVFLGKMDYFPNEDAVEVFATELFDRIRTEFPDSKFHIIGASPSDRVRKLEEKQGITVTGFVEKPQEHLCDADVFVAPMRHGAGLQNKVLEAMALGRPVVASPLAREGIDAVPGEHLLVSEIDDAFADSVTELLSDVSRRRTIGTAARKLIRRKYTWEQIGQKLRNQIGDVLEDVPGPETDT